MRYTAMKTTKWKSFAAIALAVVFTTLPAGALDWIAMYGIGSYGWAIFFGVENGGLSS